MAEKNMSEPALNVGCIKESACIHTSKIFDACKEQE